MSCRRTPRRVGRAAARSGARQESGAVRRRVESAERQHGRARVECSGRSGRARAAGQKHACATPLVCAANSPKSVQAGFVALQLWGNGRGSARIVCAAHEGSRALPGGPTPTSRPRSPRRLRAQTLRRGGLPPPRRAADCRRRPSEGPRPAARGAPASASRRPTGRARVSLGAASARRAARPVARGGLQRRLAPRRGSPPRPPHGEGRRDDARARPPPAPRRRPHLHPPPPPAHSVTSDLKCPLCSTWPAASLSASRTALCSACETVLPVTGCG